ncbi:hypothetical protein GQ44DRAFT_160840 [Phaeosphaeriaceae sp. PMI808]|nr:hypothetical protein GQ44DRAFT_160840 [Phaeosphaeriaceae sp. PMI808]
MEYMEAKNIPHFEEDVFRFFGVRHRQGWAMIFDGSVDKRHHNREDIEEQRGRPSRLSGKDIKELDRIPH